MAVQRLTDLPPELKTHIISFIHCTEDLKDVCLTNKEMRSVAIAKLYRRFVINMDRCRWPPSKGLFKAGNPGPKHVRSLQFKPIVPKDTDLALKIIRTAISIIPPDVLRETWLPAGLDLDEEVFMALCLKQQKLSAVGLGSISNKTLSPKLVEITPSSWFNNITSLYVPSLLGCMAAVTEYASIIKRAPKLEDLRIGLYADGGHQREEDTPLSSFFQAATGRVDTTEPKKPQLQRLLLVQITLSSTPTWIHQIDFLSMQNLEIVECSHPEGLLQWLAALYTKQGSRLQRLRLRADSMSSFKEVHAFLDSFSGLQCLHLQVSGRYQGEHDSFDIASLKQHRSSMTQLYVHISVDMGGSSILVPLSEEALKDITSNFLSLTSVALILPPVMWDIEDKATGQWAKFWTSLSLISKI